MSEATPYVLRVASPRGATVQPFSTAAEAYDGAAVVRRSMGDAGAVLQVEDIGSGAVLGQWRHDGQRWHFDDPHKAAPAHGH